MPVNFLRKNPMAVVLLVGGVAVAAALLMMVDGGLLKSQVTGVDESAETTIVPLSYSCESVSLNAYPVYELDDMRVVNRHYLRTVDQTRYDIEANCTPSVICQAYVKENTTCEDLDPPGTLASGSSYECESFSYTVERNTDNYNPGVTIDFDGPMRNLTQAEWDEARRDLHTLCASQYNRFDPPDFNQTLCDNSWETDPAAEASLDESVQTAQCEVEVSPSPTITAEMADEEESSPTPSSTTSPAVAESFSPTPAPSE